MYELYTKHHCDDCDLTFLVGEQEEINVNPYCPNCGNDYSVEFIELVKVTMRDAFGKESE